MKKQSRVYHVPVPPMNALTTPANLPVSAKDKNANVVPPPDEEKLMRLNKIASESPFCFYYKEKRNDLL